MFHSPFAAIPKQIVTICHIMLQTLQPIGYVTLYRCSISSFFHTHVCIYMCVCISLAQPQWQSRSIRCVVASLSCRFVCGSLSSLCRYLAWLYRNIVIECGKRVAWRAGAIAQRSENLNQVGNQTDLKCNKSVEVKSDHQW